jgi:hypothetical protein
MSAGPVQEHQRRGAISATPQKPDPSAADGNHFLDVRHRSILRCCFCCFISVRSAAGISSNQMTADIRTLFVLICQARSAILAMNFPETVRAAKG